MTAEEQALQAANEALQAQGREAELRRRLSAAEEFIKSVRGEGDVSVTGGIVSSYTSAPEETKEPASNTGFLDLWVPINGSAAQVRFTAQIL